MGLENLLRRVTGGREFRELVAEVRDGGGGRRVVSVSGLTVAPARALVVAALQHETGRRVAVVTEANRDLETWERDVRFWHAALRGGASGEDEAGRFNEEILTLPASESDPFAGASPHAETLESRALALWRLTTANDDKATDDGAPSPSIVLLTGRALARRTVRPEEILRAGARIARDEDHAPEELIAKLVASGYVREDPVRSVGCFSSRGGILDVWPPGNRAPVRIEFFGDTVDSIREFDEETQLSRRQLNRIDIAPMREYAATGDDFRLWAEAARERFGTSRFARSLRDRTVYADEGETFPGWEWLISLLHETKGSLFDYLRDFVFVVDEPAQITNHLESFYRTLEERYAAADRADDIALHPEELYLTGEELRAQTETASRVEFRALGRAAAAIDESFALDAETLAAKEQSQISNVQFQITNPGAEADVSQSSSESQIEHLKSNISDFKSQISNLKSRTDDSQASSESQIEHLKFQIGSSGSGNRAPLFLFPVVERAAEIEISSRPARAYHGRIADLARDVKSAREREGAETLFVMPSAGLSERVAEMLADYAVNARVVTFDAGAEAAAETLVTTGHLSGGFELPAARIVVHVEHDLFDNVDEGIAHYGSRRATGRVAAATEETRDETARRKRKSKTAAFLSDFRDLKPGDYVVHIDHGIARFNGLQMLDLQDRRSEFMLLTYAEDAKLYVPVERLDLVQRYSSAEGSEPTLDRLGGLGWLKTKAKAKRAMRDMADELLRLYAERKLVSGYAFSADSPWQREFEEGFEYQLTPDQATAIEDAKRDMEARTPMDRLLCGDVGYGKTEVAMRAAFKAVMDSKQVAVLTPTTVLAYQHFETFRSRFAPFPVRVELLSRFRTPKEQKEVVKQVENGEIDILIGTHRLLSKDVRFRELGLVVVDEEQRFGVAHKERLKQLKKRVDVLTLSATPIPRTLNMSLMGLRDMSVIETPPRDRLSINTQVVQFSEPVIKSAIELEMGRGGQVFFIHNRVETIDTIAALVQRLVPAARIAIAHGQMNERGMEDVMLDFIAYKYDVLVATTIIENGIDIPRANTIIINRADHYGLAQLYQLRGRVGRSNRRAYSYLLIPSEATLTPVARRRLAAIREFSDLGAGFRVAALDLELRGAGNLLGGQQSGHLDALGFDLYTQMLERTVAELRGEEVEDETSVALNLQADVSISEDYIADMGQRLRTYKRIASARDDETLRAIRAETEDRYGRIPESVERLFDYARLRRIAEEMNVLSIDRTPDGLAVKLSERARVAPEKLLSLVNRRAGATFAPSGVLRIELTDEETARVTEAAREVLLEIRAES